MNFCTKTYTSPEARILAPLGMVGAVLRGTLAAGGPPAPPAPGPRVIVRPGLLLFINVAKDLLIPPGLPRPTGDPRPRRGTKGGAARPRPAIAPRLLGDAFKGLELGITVREAGRRGLC